MIVGVTVMAGGLFLVAEVNALWQWLLLRGVLIAIGSALVGSLVVNVTLSKWFVGAPRTGDRDRRRRHLALRHRAYRR